MNLEPKFKKQVQDDWEAATPGEKSRTIQEWAKKLNCSYGTLYRKLGINKKRIQGQRKIDDIEKYVETVTFIKKKPPESAGEISTEQAIRIGIDNGLIPKDMKGKTSTFNRIISEMGLNKRKRPIQRFQAKYPNELHHIDASSSKFFYVWKKTEDGDYILRLHAANRGYKNKPVPEDRLRLWVYGLTDDHSGYHIARYVAAHGESAIDNLKFLEWAWAKNDEKVLFGLPDKIKGDLGPMMRGPATKDFLERLDVNIDPSIPENKESHGKIERPWRTAWKRFELPFFVQTDWRKFEITLNELNKQFFNYLEELNDRPHRFEKEITRHQAWQRINFRGGVVEIPENAFEKMAKRHERTVYPDGCFSLNGGTYEVKGLHDAKVWVYEGIFEDKLVVQDRKTGKKYEVRNFKPNDVGEYKAHKETPHQKAVKEAESLQVTNTLYAEPKDHGNVAHMPTRTKETRSIEDPFDADTYESMNEAMQEFISIYGFMPEEEDREAIKQLIMENGLSRRFVTSLALECQAEQERSADCG